MARELVRSEEWLANFLARTAQHVAPISPGAPRAVPSAAPGLVPVLLRDMTPERGKYRNVKTNGYASKREAKRAAILRQLQATNAIANLREQVPFVLIPRQLDHDGSVAERACVYIADFVYEENGVERVEDCKGMRTPEYVIKRKLMRFQHGIVIKET